ncbi:MAG: protein-L-isoaspartate(D-aspartate) O-methyltransferase [Gammaproteobacteria bacterium]|nr:protein-L-isoaspartate(D-aspartate) O-methyltransferase [Gammaproteobacteria bacterium]
MENADSPGQERAQMLAAIRRSAFESARYTHHPQLGERTLHAVANVPRDRFVPPDLRDFAYRNRPLPIGAGQTISQPMIVALMTDLLAPTATDTVLEIGTGSGYQAAVLARLCKHVYSIEVIPELARSSAALLADLGYSNVTVCQGDGYAGLPEHAPYDGIIVTAAPATVPPPLIEQLKVGGRMVIPVGAQGGHQDLVLIEKANDGTLKQRAVLPVAFVPFTGSHGDGGAAAQ